MRRRASLPARWFPAVTLAVGIAAVFAVSVRDAASAADERLPAVMSSTVRLEVFDRGQWWGFEATLYVAGAPGDAAESLRRAEDALLARFPTYVRQELGTTNGSGFVLSGHSWPGHTASWRYNPAGKPASLAGDAAALGAAADAWGLTGADFRFIGLGSTAADTGACSGTSADLDRVNTVGWAGQTGSTIAVTCSWFEQDEYIEFDMEFDPEWPWTTTETNVRTDLQSVATHEFGHALGLGHSSNSASIMYGTNRSGALRREPQCEDILGAIAIYGGTPPVSCNSDSTATNTPVASPSASPSPTGQPTRTPPTSVPTPTPTLEPGGASVVWLLPGANLVTWPAEPASPRTVSDAHPAAIQAIYAWDPVGELWLRWLPGIPDSANSLGELRTGHAYWFLVGLPVAIAPLSSR